MFVRHCTACQQDQLIFPSMIDALEEQAGGFAVHYTCWCHAPQVVHTSELATGSRPAPAAAA